MSLQNVRKYFEGPVIAAANALVVPIFVDNQPLTDADSTGAHILMRLAFGSVTETTLCESLENLRGSIVIEIYTPKGEGPAASQTLARAMATALLDINRTRLHPVDGVRGVTRELTGPSFAALEGKPHFFARLGCGFQASYTAP
jgi:hypothetical protein